MKKVCCFVLGIMFFMPGYGDVAKSDEAKTQKSVKSEAEIIKKDLPKLKDIKSICENEYVQDEVRILQKKVLDLLKEAIGRSNFKSKEDNENFKGDEKDIARAKERINYFVSLESSLDNADTLARVKNTLGLNLSGKEEVKKALELIEAVEDADTFQKVRNIPRINKDINKVIDKYETLEKIVNQADTLERVKNIPDINTKAVKEIQRIEKGLSEFEAISDTDSLLNNASINSNLKNQVQNLLSLESDFKNADTLDKVKQLPDVSQKFIKYVESQASENQKLKQQVKNLQKNVSDVNYRLETVSRETETERRFATMLTGVILRALIGFDYRNTTFNFEKNKELKVAEKSAMIAASKSSFSHLGGTKEDLCLITDGLHQILKSLVADKDWIKKADRIKKKLEAISIVCKRFNNDADIIKVNVDHAINIVSNLLEGAKRPPRDNVQNFDVLAEQVSKE